MKNNTIKIREVQEFQDKVRVEINKFIFFKGFAPNVKELSEILHCSTNEIEKGLKELADSKAIVLHPNSFDIWVAHPFALFPTLFWVESGEKKWWCNCIWCSLGAASLSGDHNRIHTRISGEIDPVVIDIVEGRLVQESLLVHFPIPMKRIWDNVIYTCANTLVFEKPEQIEDWCRRHNVPKGEIVTMNKAWEFSRLWYGYYLDNNWVRKTPEYASSIFQQVGFTGQFWELK